MASFYTGNTGRSKGPHLDFRVWDVDGGGYIDPTSFASHLSSGGKGLDQFTMTSPYGADRGDYIHKGVDYATELGTKIDVDGSFLTTFNDKGGGITNQYAIERDGKKYELLLMHGNDQNTVLSDAAITNGLAATNKTTPTPARSEAKAKAQDYKNMSASQLNAEYDRLRAGKDVNAAQAAGLAMHKAHFNKS
jgi:hypothetical protein